MDRISKFLSKLSSKERKLVEDIASQVLACNLEGLDVKKLKGKYNEFRVRKSGIRIIFTMSGDLIKIISIERKNDNTYKK